MTALSKEGRYEVTQEMAAQLADFYGNYADEKETADRIRELYDDHIDPLTVFDPLLF